MNRVADRIRTSGSIAYTCSRGGPHYGFDPLVAYLNSDVQPLVRHSIVAVLAFGLSDRAQGYCEGAKLFNQTRPLRCTLCT